MIDNMNMRSQTVKVNKLLILHKQNFHKLLSSKWHNKLTKIAQPVF